MLILALAAWQVPAHATDSVAQCVAIEDDATRLACFDAATGRPGRADSHRVGADVTEPVTAAAASHAAVTTQPSTRTSEQATAEFGLSAAALAKGLGIDSIAATVRSVDQSSHIGRWIVTLENGQVWEQRETTAPAKRPRPGDNVTIREAALDSYMLTAPGRGASRVRRIR